MDRQAILDKIAAMNDAEFILFCSVARFYKEEKSKKVVIGILDKLTLEPFHGDVAADVYFRDGEIYILS